MVSPFVPSPASPSFARAPLRFLAVFAILSVVLVTIQVALYLRNIPYADEIDVVLTNALHLDLSQVFPDRLANLFAIQNEHRLFTSSLLFATLYRLTGTFNFVFIGVVGNLYLLALCALILERAGSWARGLRLAAVLGLVVTQLQHHENFFWSGSSIDHFHVVLLAVAAFAALSDGTRRGLLGGLLFGLLGTYTLAHGTMIWPVGAALLASQRRWRALACWAGVATFAAACYLPGFVINPGHHIEAASNVPRVLQFWLTLLGATPAVSNLHVAPWLGAGLLGSVLWLARRGAWRAQPFVGAVITFCILALGLIAVGRTGLSASTGIPSRYCILSALAWALIVWVVLERELARPAGSRARISLACAALVALNLTLNFRFFREGERFAQRREDTAERFHYYHTFAGSPFGLYPLASRADQVFQEVAARGIYTLPNPSQRIEIPDPQEVGNITYHFDEVKTDADNVYIYGWAFGPERDAPPGGVHVVFQSASFFQVYTALRVPRPDVVANLHAPQLLQTGFRLVVPRRELPGETCAVGVLLKRPFGAAEFVVSNRWVELSSGTSSATRLLTHR